MEVDDLLDSTTTPVANGEQPPTEKKVAEETVAEPVIDEEVAAAESVANLVVELAEEVAKANPNHEQMDTDDQLTLPPATPMETTDKPEELPVMEVEKKTEQPVEVTAPPEPEVTAAVAVEKDPEVPAPIVESTEKVEEEKKTSIVSGPRILQLNDMLSWLNSTTPPLSPQELCKFKITFSDFKDALKLVQPSAKREGFITVPDVTWDDIGSLSDIREELKLAILAPVKFPKRLRCWA